MIILPSSAGIYRPFISSGPTPPISANLARWYSANYGVTSSGGVVSQMDDLSGNGQHATQSTSGKRPSLITNARKTNSMISFDGVDDAITFNGITLTGDFSIYWVGSIEETPGNSSGYFTQNDNGGASSTNGVNNFASGVYWYNNGGDILADNLGRVYQTSLDIVCIRRTGSTITCEINDLDASTSPGNSNPTIGCIGHAFIGYSQMRFGEMLVYTSYHNATDKATVTNALKSTWEYPTLPVSGAALWLDGSRWDTLYTTDTGSTSVTTNGGAIGRWEDLSGNARHAKQGTAGNRPTWVSPNNGRIGLGAVAFNGSQWIDLDNTSSYNLGSSNFTIEGWFKLTTTTQPSTFIAKDLNGNRSWILFYESNSTINFVMFSGVNGSGAKSLANSYTLGVNTWFHIAVVRSGNTVSMYINGVLQANTVDVTGFSAAANTSAIRLGMHYASTNGYNMKGQIQNAIIWPQALYTSNFTPFMSS